MRKIGYIWNGYPEKRMIIGKVIGFKYIELSPYWDIKILLFRIIEKIYKKFRDDFTFFNRIIFNYKPLLIKKVDIFHSFNRIYYGKQNWVVTFENIIPTFRDNTVKYKMYSKARIKYLLNENCKAILPMSSWSYKKTVDLWCKVATENEVNKLISKTKIMPPPQEILISYNKLINKFDNINGEINFVFVGRDFWRKGGEIAVRALQKIRKTYDIKFTVISKLDITEQAYNPKSNKDMLTYLNLNKDWITYYSELDNKKVIEILKNSHIGLLPTWFDTYGFSVLEMQAAGCPVVTTNINALPEINNDDRGWLLDIQSIIDKIGDDYYNIDVCNNIKNYMINNLIICVNNILSNRSEIKEKAINAYKYIEMEHLPQNYARDMKNIYQVF